MWSVKKNKSKQNKNNKYNKYINSKDNIGLFLLKNLKEYYGNCETFNGNKESILKTIIDYRGKPILKKKKEKEKTQNIKNIKYKIQNRISKIEKRKRKKTINEIDSIRIENELEQLNQELNEIIIKEVEEDKEREIQLKNRCDCFQCCLHYSEFDDSDYITYYINNY